MALIKAHLADFIHNQIGLPRNQSVQVLESILEIIKKTLGNGVGWVKRQKGAGFRCFNIIYLTSLTCKLIRISETHWINPAFSGTKPTLRVVKFQ